MFLLGVRTSTWLTAAAFVTVAIIRRDRKALLAGWVWLSGFEAAFQVTAMTLGHPLPLGVDGPIFYLALGLITVPWFTRQGISPNLWVIGCLALLWAIWIAVGFPVNQHSTARLNVEAEMLNEGAKSLWALAYLLPFWPTTPSRQRGVLRQPAASLITDDG
jgi:hypothetical protein